MDELISDFAADTRDGYDQVRRYLDVLDASSMDRATLDAVFRFVHTVRGNASFLNIERIERLCAPTEYILSKVREDSGTPPPTLVAAVIAIVDRLGAIAEAMEEGVNLPAGDEMALISALGPAGDGSAPPVALRRSLRAPTIRLSVEKFDTLITTIESLEVAQRALLDQVARQALPVDLDSVLAQVTTAISATCLLGLIDLRHRLHWSWESGFGLKQRVPMCQSNANK
jgi:two-component system, chemotaxis family, sensor kinase CheA